MSVKPVGLSPCFDSVISGFIPGSMTFSWTAPWITIGGAQVEFYDGETRLTARSVGGNVNSFTADTELINLLDESRQHSWRVRVRNTDGVYGPWSEYATFKYGSIDPQEWFSWMTMPPDYSEVGEGELLIEIRDALIAVTMDYAALGVDDEDEIVWQASSLFEGPVVPARRDFLLLEELLNRIAEKKEGISYRQVAGVIGDGMGLKDLVRIREYLSAIMASPPQPPSQVRVVPGGADIQQVTSLTGAPEGSGSNYVNVEWGSDVYEERPTQIVFGRPSGSEDISYYAMDFIYGIDGKKVVQRLYYRADGVQDKLTYSFDTSFSTIATANTSGTVTYETRIASVDRRGNRSQERTLTATIAGGAKVPLGLWYYQVQYQKEGQSTWQNVGAKDRFEVEEYRHNLGEANFKLRYRARVVDRSGMSSDWFESAWVDFRGIMPPGPPRQLRYTSTTSKIDVAWDPGWHTTSHEIRSKRAGGTWTNWAPKSTNTHQSLDRDASTTYYYEVRGKNSIGVSKAVALTAVTKAPPLATATFNSRRNGISWRTDYRGTVGGVFRSYPGGWRTETTDVIQGKWEYLENTYDDWDMDGRKDDYVLKGMHNGIHRGLWFLDKAAIERTIGRKRIKSAEIEVERVGSQHGWPKDGTPLYLWLHDYASPPSGRPTLRSRHVSKVNFTVGQKKWVPIPIEFVQSLSYGAAQGIAVYKDTTIDQYDHSYQRFEPKIRLRVTYYND